MAAANGAAANGEDTKAAFARIYGTLKDELLKDPAFDFTHESHQWVDRDGADDKKDAVFGAADYSCVLGVSENLGYGESSSSSSNWNEVGSVIDAGEVLRWAAKAEPAFTDMEQKHGVYGEQDDALLEEKFSLPSCQEQSFLANFDFNLEYF